MGGLQQDKGTEEYGDGAVGRRRGVTGWVV